MSKGNIQICEKPAGDQTTILDLCDRDNQDDFLFPLDTNTSWFARDSSRRVLPFTTVIQEFAYKGTGTWNGKIQFDIGSYKPCDLLFTVALQIKLDHWFSPIVIEKIKNKKLVFKDPKDAWFYANSLGTILVKEAELLVEDHTIEKVSGDFANVFSLLYPDMNTQFGINADAYGQVGINQLLRQNVTRMYPTEDGWITCILPFSFQREKLRATFPLMSVKEGSMRIRLTLRPFNECVRKNSLNRAGLEDSPLNKTFTFIDTTYPYYHEETVTTGHLPPDFKSIQLITYGCILDGKYRQALLHKPFDRIYRDVQTFTYDEPTKYTMTISGKDTIQVTLPLECNGPIEEILWFIRRKAVNGNNEWTNYTSVLEREYDPVFQPMGTLLLDAAIQVDGTDLVYGSEKYFRRNIGQKHKGGIISYLNNIYGYNFATKPGTHDPSGWFNASRANDVRIRMRIMPPGGTRDLDWTVIVFVIGVNWIRFQNGLASKVFNS
jgi:hypothetical protein